MDELRQLLGSAQFSAISDLADDQDVAEKAALDLDVAAADWNRLARLGTASARRRNGLGTEPRPDQRRCVLGALMLQNWATLRRVPYAAIGGAS